LTQGSTTLSSPNQSVPQSTRSGQQASAEDISVSRTSTRSSGTSVSQPSSMPESVISDVATTGLGSSSPSSVQIQTATSGSSQLSSSSTSPVPTETPVQRISPNGLCGHLFGYTCEGSNFGQCCGMGGIW
jgi:hypothetical protein